MTAEKRRTTETLVAEHEMLSTVSDIGEEKLSEARRTQRERSGCLMVFDYFQDGGLFPGGLGAMPPATTGDRVIFVSS